MRQFKVILGILPIALVACGCGGDGTAACGDASGSFFAGGDSGSAGSGGDDSSVSPSSSVRVNATGDVFNYIVTGQYTAVGGTAKVDTSGTAAETFTTNTFGGQSSLLDSLSTVITVAGAQSTFLDARQLNASGLTLGQTDNGTMQPVSSGGLTLPSSLTSSTNLTASELLANGTTVAITFKVTGTASITTNAGTFDCWKIVRTATYSDGATVKSELAFAPAIGATVLAHYHNTYSSGLSDSLLLKLDKYTLGG